MQSCETLNFGSLHHNEIWGSPFRNHDIHTETDNQTLCSLSSSFQSVDFLTETETNKPCLSNRSLLRECATLSTIYVYLVDDSNPYDFIMKCPSKVNPYTNYKCDKNGLLQPAIPTQKFQPNLRHEYTSPFRILSKRKMDDRINTPSQRKSRTIFKNMLNSKASYKFYTRDRFGDIQEYKNQDHKKKEKDFPLHAELWQSSNDNYSPTLKENSIKHSTISRINRKLMRLLLRS